MATDFAALATKLLERARSRGLARVVTLCWFDATPPKSAISWIPAVDPRAHSVTLAVTAVFNVGAEARDLRGVVVRQLLRRGAPRSPPDDGADARGPNREKAASMCG
jgi:hypothetical protein